MYLHKIILWPLDVSKQYRCIDFESGKVNYIVGEPDTGKSSIWPIIDYCLGSSKLKIPIGLVRASVSWYGIILKAKDEEVLIARKNNSLSKSYSEYMMLTGGTIIIPATPVKNITPEKKVKDFLSKEFDVFKDSMEIEILKELEDHKIGSYSFRDLLYLNHQMQYALVNPSSFVSDTNYLSVIKLRKMLPIFLYPKGRSYYKIKKSIQSKVEIQLQTIAGEIDYLKQRMITLYKEAHRIGLVHNYLEPDENTGVQAEVYRKYLHEIYIENKVLLNNNAARITGTETQQLQKAYVLGKINECLKFSVIISRLKELTEKYMALDTDIKQLEYDMKNKRDTEVLSLSRLIQIYSREMNLDFQDYIPVFDEREAMLKFQIGYNDDFYLYELGSPQNYVGYNIATFLGFHEIFLKYNYKFIFPFLIIDHPSHVFSESGEEHEKVESLFAALDFAVKRMNNKLQIIVLERRIPSRISDLPNSTIIERWSRNEHKALIPENWVNL